MKSLWVDSFYLLILIGYSQIAMSCMPNEDIFHCLNLPATASHEEVEYAFYIKKHEITSANPTLDKNSAYSVKLSRLQMLYTHYQNQYQSKSKILKITDHENLNIEDLSVAIRSKVHDEQKASFIKDGYGDFAVFERTMDGKLLNLALDAEKCIKFSFVIQKYSLQKLIETYTDVEKFKLALKSRSQDLLHEMKRLFPQKNLVIALIPKTLYELVYINQYLKQSSGQGPKEIDPLPGEEKYDANAESNDNPLVHKLSCQMNKVLAEQLSVEKIEVNIGFKNEQLEINMSKQLKIFKDNLRNIRKKGEVTHLPAEVKVMVTDTFNDDTALGRKNIVSANELMTRAMQVEMQSPGKVLVYRGGQLFEPDTIRSAKEGGTPLSFATSLWAGFHDPNGNTCAIRFMLNGKKAYILAVPAEKLMSSYTGVFPIHIPRGNTVKQLASINQISHAWALGEQITGMEPSHSLKGIPDDKLNFSLDKLVEIQKEFNDLYASRYELMDIIFDPNEKTYFTNVINTIVRNVLSDVCKEIFSNASSPCQDACMYGDMGGPAIPPIETEECTIENTDEFCATFWNKVHVKIRKHPELQRLKDFQRDMNFKLKQDIKMSYKTINPQFKDARITCQ